MRKILFSFLSVLCQKPMIHYFRCNGNELASFYDQNHDSNHKVINYSIPRFYNEVFKVVVTVFTINFFRGVDRLSISQSSLEMLGLETARCLLMLLQSTSSFFYDKQRDTLHRSQRNLGSI